MKRLVIAVMLLGLVGCGIRPLDLPEQGDYGPRPETPVTLAEDWLGERLVGGNSSHLPLVPGYIVVGDSQLGWIQCGTIEARNNAGRFIGQTYYAVLIRDGVVVDGVVDDRTSTSAIAPYIPAEITCLRAHTS